LFFEFFRHVVKILFRTGKLFGKAGFAEEFIG